jgi:hypothetical protein
LRFFILVFFFCNDAANKNCSRRDGPGIFGARAWQLDEHIIVAAFVVVIVLVAAPILAWRGRAGSNEYKKCFKEQHNGD